MRWMLFALTTCTMLAASSAGLLAEDDPRLEKILDHWKKLPEDLQSCQLSGRRFVYDSVFQVEKRAKFEIAWEKDGRAIYRITKVNIPEGARSQQLTPQGKAYSLKSDVEETWYLPNQEELIQVTSNRGEKLACRYELSPQTQTEPKRSNGFFDFDAWEMVDSMKQLLVELPIHPALTDLADELTWTITAEHKHAYLLAGIRASTNSPHARNFKEINLMVRKADSSIIAMKILDHAGTTRTVYVFDKRETNPRFGPNAEVFNIHEEKLKFIEPNKATPEADEASEFPTLTLLIGIKLAVRLFAPGFP